MAEKIVIDGLTFDGVDRGNGIEVDTGCHHCHWVDKEDAMRLVRHLVDVFDLPVGVR